MTKIKLRMVTSLSGTMGDTTYRTLSPGNIVVSDKAALPTFENEEDKTARDARADQFGAVNALFTEPANPPAVTMDGSFRRASAIAR